MRATNGQSTIFGHGDVLISLLLVYPLFVAYQVGVLFVPTLNGADLVTPLALSAVDQDPTYYLLGLAGLTAGYLATIFYLHRAGRLAFSVIPPMIAESTIYALTLGTFIVFVMQTVLGFHIVLSLGESDTLLAANLGSAGDALVMSLGAGVHEELVFRLGIMTVAIAVLQKTGARKKWATIGALLLSSFAFAAAHHIGAHGQAFQLDTFTYRVLAGAMFGLIYYYRSLAHAVYAHFLYDFYVLVIRGAV